MPLLNRAAAAFALLFASAISGSATEADPGAPSDPALVARGAYLARVGDCEACHTQRGGAPYAGGAAIHSPYGPLYAPNITPDREQGIGAWTDDEFYRAMHEGVGRGGENLYPAFPYQWFTRVTRDDVLAIRAYLRTIPPSPEPSRKNRLMFPFDVRAGLAAWNKLFFHEGELRPDPSKPPEWNRGAYLVEGLGHCGDCHTPRGLAMEPIRARAYAGGSVDDWYAADITSDPDHGIGAWSEDDLVGYFKTGVRGDRSVAAGPMAEVVHDSLSKLDDADLHAIAVYLKTIPPVAVADAARPSGETGPRPSGAAAYASHCAFCHGLDGRGRPGAVPALDGNDLVRAQGPEDVIRVVLGGHLATGAFAPMPAVGAGMTDQEIEDVVDYVRTAWSNRAPVVRETGLVGRIRAKTVAGLAGPGNRTDDDPCRLRPAAPPVPTIDDPAIAGALDAIEPADMLPTVRTVTARAREILPRAAEADLVNGLMLAFCRVEAKAKALDKPDGRRALDQFGQLVYSELRTSGRE